MSRTSRHDDGGALTGPAVSVSTAPGTSRGAIEIAGSLCPGGGEVRPPSAADPYWRGPDRQRRNLSEVVAGQSVRGREELISAHAEAIAEVARAAAAARVAGEPKSARALVAAASRLCRELIGQA